MRVMAASRTWPAIVASVPVRTTSSGQLALATTAAGQLGTVVRCERRDDLLDRLRAEVDDERRAVLGEAGEVLALGHLRRAAAVAREDDRLRDAGDRELALERRRRGGEGGHAGRDVPGDVQLVEAAHLLGGGAEDREVAGVQAGDVVSCVVCLLQLGDDLVEREGLRVDDAGVRRGVGEDLRRHERARVEADRRACDEALGAQREQVGGAGPGADEVHRHLTTVHWTTGSC